MPAHCPSNSATPIPWIVLPSPMSSAKTARPWETGKGDAIARLCLCVVAMKCPSVTDIRTETLTWINQTDQTDRVGLTVGCEFGRLVGTN